MAISATLKLKTIKGESAIKGHEERIDVLSWSWGITQSASAHVAAGAGTGSADVKDLRITKYVDKSTPTLYQSCFKGDDIGPGTLTLMKVSGDKALEYVTITMESTVIISSITSGDALPNDRFTESVTLNFGKATFVYTPQGDGQKPGGAVTGTLAISKQYG
jgi:type VI secretion system secreted protein Hcp